MDKENYKQLCVWHGTTLGDSTKEDLINWLAQEFDIRAIWHTQIKTEPDYIDGTTVPNTGNRNDIFFFIHNDDISKFSVPRLQYGIRWWEDVINNGNHHVYPKEFIKANPKTW